MRFDRFTERAQDAAMRAYEMMQRYGHSQVDVEHLFLALLEQPKGLVCDILERSGAPIDLMKEKLVENLQRTLARGEDERNLANTNLTTLMEKLGTLSDHMRTEQTLMMRLLEDRLWLADHPVPATTPMAQRTPASLIERQAELEQLLSTAPADQRGFIDRIALSVAGAFILMGIVSAVFGLATIIPGSVFAG